MSAAARFQNGRRPSVDEEDAVADGVQHARRPLALGGDRERCRLRRLEPAALGVEARVPVGGAHQRDQPLDDLELLRRELGSAVITWTTPTTFPSCLTGTIIAARVGGGPSSGSFRNVPSPSTS